MGFVITTLFIYFLIFFFIGTWKKNNGLVDVGWGGGFAVLSVALMLRQPDLQLGHIVITLSVLIWGVRLVYHLGVRNIGKPEDFRYVNMRKRWGDKLPLLKAFLNVYMLQMMFMLIVSMPIYSAYFQKEQVRNWPIFLGGLIFLIGFAFESVGDAQLKRFKQQPDSKGKLMTTGLWSITRHPNYFGEAVLWWGIYIMALAFNHTWWSFIGALTIHLLVRYLSGVPMLEKKYEGRADFEDYKAKTAIFVPFLKKRQRQES